jgi:transposase
VKEKIKNWLTKITVTKLTCHNRFIKTLNKYFDEVTNYFIVRNNSGFFEGFNNFKLGRSAAEFFIIK